MGFAACGFAAADDFPDYPKALDAIVGRFPETGGFYAPMYRRASVRNNFPWAKSLVVCLRFYGKYLVPPGISGCIGKNYLFDSRVAPNPDYSVTRDFTGYLRSLGMKVRKGGLPDRLAAARAGVASVARNNFSYSQGLGTWFNIVSYAVDGEFEPDKPLPEAPCPEGCDACIKACPTGALTGPYTMRMDRCVAFLTYGATLPLDPELARRMGRWIYGCDACQEACPLNRGIWQEKESLGYLDEISWLLNPGTLSVMDEEVYRKAIQPLFPYIPADNPGRWRYNAGRALAEMSKQDKS